MMNIRRHNATKRWAPGASFLLATALLLLVLSPATHAAAMPCAAQSDAVFWLLREMQDEARGVASSLPLQNFASEDDDETHCKTAALLASTRAIENAAQHLFTSPKTLHSTLRFAAHSARDVSIQTVSHKVPPSRETFSHRVAQILPSLSCAASARISQAAPCGFIDSTLREYSRQLHSAAYRSGVRSKSFPQ